MYLWNYNILTGAGQGVTPMMNALYEKKIYSYNLEQSAPFKTNYKEKFLQTWNDDLKQIFESDLELGSHFKSSALRYGVILATTKGHHEDYIWASEKDRRIENTFPPQEPGALLLKDFLHSLPLHQSEILGEKKPLRSTSISQACSSSPIAFEVAQYWIDWDWVDFVIILAGDLIGPFVSKGFASLKLMASQSQKPFDQTRDGLFLGDAIGCAIVSRHKPHRDCIKLHAFTNHTEGAVTRPSLSGDSLFQALQKLRQKNRSPQPDFVLAHGTGTRFNDTAEDRALSRYFKTNHLAEVPVTGTKWSLGHTLGGSGLVDLIAAAEILKRQKIFSIASSTLTDSEFQYKNYYLECDLTKATSLKKRTLDQSLPTHPLKEALITSLGFGGVHAASWIERVTK